MKWYSVFMIVFLCTACSNDGGTEKDPSDQFHVDILFSTSGLGDSGYNDAILYGIQQASMKHGFKVNFHQPKTMEAGWECYRAWLNEPDDAVKKLFIFASNDYEKQLRANHPSTKENRDILFFESDSPIENVGSFRLNMYGASYYIGKLAGSIVPTAATLMANPYDTPITESEEGFRAGYCSESEPDNYDVFYLTDDKHKGYNMPDTAYRITYKIAQTHSFVWPLAGGSNIGVFQYTREYLPTLFTAGMDVDMSGLSFGIVCSLLKRMDLVLDDYLSRWMKGERITDHMVYGLDTDYIQIKISDIYLEYFEGLSELTTGLKEEAIEKEKQYENK